MSNITSKANNRRSKVRAVVEHVFARQKDKIKLFVRTIGITRAAFKIGMANIACNMLRCLQQPETPYSIIQNLMTQTWPKSETKPNVAGQQNQIYPKSLTEPFQTNVEEATIPKSRLFQAVPLF